MTTAIAEVRCGGRDQRVKLFFPHPHQDAPVLPEGGDGDWFAQWRAMDPSVRAVMRTYTVREHRKDADELDIDFAVHGPDGGPATQWALRARVGSRVGLLGPILENNGAVDFQQSQDTDWVLLTADETALPAVEAILAWLPPTMLVRAWVEVACAQDIRELPTQAQAEITLLVRDAADAHTGKADLAEEVDEAALVCAVRAAQLPDGKPYAWIAGESSVVRALRRQLVRERGFEREAVVFTGYWRRGAGEDDLIAERFNDTTSDED
jgi:NADPH-dependent ferric siderophore reductase